MWELQSHLFLPKICAVLDGVYRKAVRQEKMQTLKPEILNIITRRLIEEFSPRKIILFGSHAWGTPHRDSDIDLLVIVEQDEFRPTQRASRAYRCLRGLALPVEVIVSTINEIQQNLQIPSSLTRKILEKGKVLYG